MTDAALLFGAGDFTDSGTTESGTSASLVFDGTALTNAAVGDLIVVLVHGQVGNATPVSAPAPWQLVGGPGGTTSQRQSGIYYFPIKSSTDLATLKASHTFPFLGGAGRASGTMARAVGIDLDNPVMAQAGAWSVFAAATLAVTGLTLTGTALLVGAVVRNDSSPKNTSLVSFGSLAMHVRKSSTSTAISNTLTALGAARVTATGATGAITATLDAAPTNAAAELVAFKEGPWSPPAPANPGKAVKYASAPGVISTGKLYVADGAGGLVTPAEVRVMPSGYASVTAALAALSDKSFRCAHRGGSVNWPEMSRHAYTQSVLWGMPALEVSVNMTSDGVLVGIHDTTLDRTSGVTGVNVSALTWAQVQGYQISNISGLTVTGQVAQPYLRLEQLLDDYGSSHVMFVDPKGLTAAQRITLLDLLDARGGPARFVGKYYGVSGNAGNTTGPAVEFTSRGYQCWGYFYAADSASYAAYAPRWTILGQDYAADQASWDALRTAGGTRKIIGHIVPSAAAATLALGKGADGLMVSGVVEAVTRTPNAA